MRPSLGETEFEKSFYEGFVCTIASRDCGSHLGGPMPGGTKIGGTQTGGAILLLVSLDSRLFIVFIA